MMDNEGGDKGLPEKASHSKMGSQHMSQWYPEQGGYTGTAFESEGDVGAKGEGGESEGQTPPKTVDLNACMREYNPSAGGMTGDEMESATDADLTGPPLATTSEDPTRSMY